MSLPDVERQQQEVWDLLKDLRGVEQLKRLFWTQLNYDRVKSGCPKRIAPVRATSKVMQGGFSP